MDIIIPSISYMGIKICGIYDIWMPKRIGARAKVAPWTTIAIKTGVRSPATPTTIADPMSGGVFDADAEKSLGRWIGDYRYYSKATKDVDKGACIQRARMLQVPPKDIEPYIPEGSFPVEDGVDYGIECMEQSYAYRDEDGVQKFQPKWKPVYTDAEREERSHWRRSVPTYEEVEVEELGDYGFVESEY